MQWQSYHTKFQVGNVPPRPKSPLYLGLVSNLNEDNAVEVPIKFMAIPKTVDDGGQEYTCKIKSASGATLATFQWTSYAGESQVMEHYYIQ